MSSSISSLVGKNPKSKIEAEPYLNATSQGPTPEDARLPPRLRPRFQPVGLPGRMLGDYALSESETGGSSLQLGEKDAHTRGPPEADS